MRTYYQVLFTQNNRGISKRFEAKAFSSAAELCRKVKGTIRICKEPIRVIWGF